MATLDNRRIELLDPAVVAVLRAKSPHERLAMGFDCQRTARLVLAAHLRQSHVDWDDGRIQAEIARRMTLGTG